MLAHVTIPCVYSSEVAREQLSEHNTFVSDSYATKGASGHEFLCEANQTLVRTLPSASVLNQH
jgi:hypothetical protein